jgi:hypothetical protein
MIESEARASGFAMGFAALPKPGHYFRRNALTVVLDSNLYLIVLGL